MVARRVTDRVTDRMTDRVTDRMTDRMTDRVTKKLRVRKTMMVPRRTETSMVPKASMSMSPARHGTPVEPSPQPPLL